MHDLAHKKDNCMTINMTASRQKPGNHELYFKPGGGNDWNERPLGRQNYSFKAK